VQYDRIQLGDNSSGYLVNVPLNTILYGVKFHVVSLALDFLF
jgi:hypothetical protein